VDPRPSCLGDILIFQDPTAIQRQAIPIGLQCRDIIGVAETGKLERFPVQPSEKEVIDGIMGNRNE
jgi:hypothetical protein